MHKALEVSEQGDSTLVIPQCSGSGAGKPEAKSSRQLFCKSPGGGGGSHVSHLCRTALSEGLRRGSRFGNPEDHVATSVRGPAVNGNGSRAGSKRNSAGCGQCDGTNIHPCGEAKKAVDWREPLELETGLQSAQSWTVLLDLQCPQMRLVILNLWLMTPGCVWNDPFTGVI